MTAEDFNATTDTSEFQGHDIAPDDNRICRFNDNINNCGLIDLGASGPKMTWSNGKDGFAHTLKRLDRALGDGEFIKFPEAAITNLPRTTSYHSPLLINLTGTILNPLFIIRLFVWNPYGSPTLALKT